MNNRPHSKAQQLAGFIGLGFLILAPSAQAVDWKSVPEKKIVLLYPGQASWEWVMTQSDHSGAQKFKEGKNCSGCHEGEQADMGKALLSGTHKAEAAPAKGKPGSQTLFVKTAHDAQHLYFQFRFKPSPAGGTKMDPNVAARITVMLDDGGLKESSRAGCWASCHDDALGMKSAPAGGKITKYYGGSRVKLTRQGGGTNYKPTADLNAMIGKSAYFEFWQAALAPGKPAKAVGGIILDQRKELTNSGVTAKAEQINGEWLVTLSRPMKAGAEQKAITPGKLYALGFALHDDHSNHRFHHVSLGHSLRLDSGAADFIATSK